MSHSEHHRVQGTVWMIVVSITVSYFLLSNVMLIGPIYNHVNKVYMALLMGSTMGAIAAVTMPPTPDGAVSWSLLIGSMIVSLILVGIIRRQLFITDQQFVRGMVEHHEMAILMSRRVLEHTQNEAVRRLATEIITSQQREIGEMVSWIRYGFPPRSKTDQSMMQMNPASSTDREFLEMMILHHAAAVDMSQRILQTPGVSPQVRALAEKIINEQNTQIATMKSMCLSDMFVAAPVTTTHEH